MVKLEYSHRNVEEAVLFAFDTYGIPLRNNLELHLIHGKQGGGKPPIVLGNGPPGSADEHAHYYGTTIEIDGKLHMWYIGRVGRNEERANYEGDFGRLCYAVSDDGQQWEKPQLEIVEYNGSKNNNLVDFPIQDLNAAVVLYDSEEPDSQRRYKCCFEAPCYENSFAVAYSPDGFHWKEGTGNPVGFRLEQAGLIRWGDAYFVNGQGPGHPGPGRKVLTYMSYDFERWSEASVLSHSRSPIIEGPAMEDRSRCWEEIHLGTALHNRDNVILGIYGMFHGDPQGDRRRVTMDLGLLYSIDAMHFTEPIPDFRFIPAAEERESTLGFGPALMQGQGMAHRGDRTLYWYSLWRSDGQVRLASWERDRFGFVRPKDPHSRAVCLTAPFIADHNTRVSLNVSGLGEHTGVKVELLDKAFRPVPGYSGTAAEVIRTNGLRVPVSWSKGGLLPTDTPFRLRVDFGSLGSPSVRPEDARLYAVYLGSEGEDQ